MTEQTIRDRAKEKKTKQDTVRMVLPRSSLALPDGDLASTLTMIPPAPGSSSLHRPAGPLQEPAAPDPQLPKFTETAPSWMAEKPQPERQPVSMGSQEDIVNAAEALLAQLKQKHG
jgi:hypothetical protein